MKTIAAPVIVLRDDLHVNGIYKAFMLALAQACRQLADENHPEDGDVDFLLQFRVVDKES